MNMATASIVLQAIEAMAIPIFAVLTLEGFEKTASVKKYLLRLLALAVVSEVPYHLARTGQLWEPAPRNPVFGLVIAVVMLYLMRTYSFHFTTIFLPDAFFTLVTDGLAGALAA